MQFNLKSTLTKADTKDKYIFWDIDGTLAPYRFNNHVGDPEGTNSGMSLNDIIEYINLAKYGNNTYQERKNLLIKSKQILLEKMSNLQSMIEKANYQINNYDNILVPKTDALIF